MVRAQVSLGLGTKEHGATWEQVSTRILGRRTRLSHLSLFLTASRVVLPKILVLTAHGGATWEQGARQLILNVLGASGWEVQTVTRAPYM